MPNFNRSEEAKRNRQASMVDDTAGDSILTVNTAQAEAKKADPFAVRKQLRQACSIPLDKIIADPDQPRKVFDEDALAMLAASIESRGQLQPIRVRWDQARGIHVVVVGERRWRAAAIAGKKTIECVVVDGTPAAAEVLEDQLVENAIREGLKPTEQARAFRTLREALDLTQEQLAAKLKISQTTVSQSLTLLALPESVQAQVDAGEITLSAAYKIAKVADPAAAEALAEKIVTKKLSREETAEEVRRAAGKGKGRGASKGKAKGKPRLPAELKHKGACGVRIVALTSAKHTQADVVDALEEFARRLRDEMEQGAQEAA